MIAVEKYIACEIRKSAERCSFGAVVVLLETEVLVLRISLVVLQLSCSDKTDVCVSGTSVKGRLASTLLEMLTSGLERMPRGIHMQNYVVFWRLRVIY